MYFLFLSGGVVSLHCDVYFSARFLNNLCDQAFWRVPTFSGNVSLIMLYLCLLSLKIRICAGGMMCVGIIKSAIAMSVLSLRYVIRFSFLVCIAVMFVVSMWFVSTVTCAVV